MAAGGTGASTTVWDWLDQINAGFVGGHNDWRVPTRDGDPGAGGDDSELESLLDVSAGECGGGSGRYETCCIQLVRREAGAPDNAWRGVIG